MCFPFGELCTSWICFSHTSQAPPQTKHCEKPMDLHSLLLFRLFGVGVVVAVAKAMAYRIFVSFLGHFEFSLFVDSVAFTCQNMLSEPFILVASNFCLAFFLEAHNVRCIFNFHNPHIKINEQCDAHEYFVDF